MKKCGPVLVTGASTGIGRAIVEILASSGHLVYATARRESDMRILEHIPNVDPIRLDVTKPATVEKAAETVKKRGEGLFGLVNNAGVAVGWPLPTFDVEDMIQDFDVNVFGVHRITNAMLPFLIRSKGRIVNITSINGLSSEKYFGAYSMTKHALEAYSDALSSELEKYNVKVSVVEPGRYPSDIWQKGLVRILRIAEKHKAKYFGQEAKEIVEWAASSARSAAKEPRPRIIPDAVMDALFSKHPRFRYCPCANEGELTWAIEGPIVRSVQANLGGGESAISKEELHSMLDKVWDKEAKKPRLK